MVCSMSRVTSFGAAAPGTRTAPIRRSARLTIWRIASRILKTRAFSALHRSGRFPENAWWSQAESNCRPLDAFRARSVRRQSRQGCELDQPDEGPLELARVRAPLGFSLCFDLGSSTTVGHCGPFSSEDTRGGSDRPPSAASAARPGASSFVAALDGGAGTQPHFREPCRDVSHHFSPTCALRPFKVENYR
jgi:hypothetical protein